MASKSATSLDSKVKDVPTTAASIRHGELAVAEDHEVSDFYDNSVSKAYRLKSELVAAHLAEIGMGR